MKSRSRSFAGILAIAVLVAACGSDDDDQPGAGETAAVASTGETAATTEATPDETLAPSEAPGETRSEGTADPDGVLVFGASTVPNNLDPHKTLFSADGLVLYPVYDRLVHLRPDGELVPGLARSWEFSDDAMTLTLTLQPGVTFHDGTPFDSAAVKANLDRARSLENSAVKTELAAISDITTPDPLTVVIALSQPNAAIIGSLSERAGTMISPAALDSGVNLEEQMVGTGPFRFVEYRQADRLVLERNPDYWDSEHAAGLSRLEFVFLPDAAARVNALRSGQVDMATVPTSAIGDFESGEFETVPFTSLYQTLLITNFSHKGLDDVRVRRAILHGLDRQGMCDAVFDGYCEVSDQPFPPGYFAHDDEIDEVLYPFDPVRATELLAEAGVDGLTLDVLVPGEAFAPLAEIVQAQLAEIGVQVNLQPAGPEMADTMFVRQAADMVVVQFGGRPDPALMFLQRYSPQGFYNPGGVSTPAMEQLIEESLATTDPEERLAPLRAGSREAAESALPMMLFFAQTIYVTDGTVEFEPYITGNLEFRDVSIRS